MTDLDHLARRIEALEAAPNLVEGLIVLPGDTLVVRVDPGTDIDETVALRDGIKASLDDAIKVVMIAADQLAVAQGPETVTQPDEAPDNVRRTIHDLIPPAEPAATATGDAGGTPGREIPVSVIGAVLEATGSYDDRWTDNEPGLFWNEAERIARAAIEAWEAHQALPKITIDFDHNDNYLWWWVCSLDTCPGFRGGHGTEAEARASGDAHLAATHAGATRVTPSTPRPNENGDDVAASRYRVGNHNPHLIYRGSARRADDEQFLAACMTADIAAELIAVLNGADAEPADDDDHARLPSLGRKLMNLRPDTPRRDPHATGCLHDHEDADPTAAGS